jgi:hypothetical protein
MSEYDNDIIKIELSIFKEHYANCHDKETISMTHNFLNKKKAEIYSNVCFHTTYESFYHGQNATNNNHKHYQHNHQNSDYYYRSNYSGKHNYNTYKKPQHSLATNNHLSRLYIVNTDFTEEAKLKKQFISYLNKLTKQNMHTLYPKIKEHIDKDNNDILYDIIWEFIKKSPDELYINILKYFSQNKTEEKYAQYVKDKEWIPDDSICESNILQNNDELYDKYCEYVKWKKETTSMNKAWCSIYNQNDMKHITLVTDIYNMFLMYKERSSGINGKEYKHIVDFCLEQLFIFSKFTKVMQDFTGQLKQFDLASFESSTKFLIMNIIEL